MSRYQPPYTITPTILNRVAEISELLGQWSAQQGELSPHLRRKNRIRTIQASLAIENNTLSIGQVTDIVEGKRILGLPREVQEVKNALAAYDQLPHWQPTRAEDILSAHGLLMQGLAEDAGLWRTKGVGVFRGKTLLHMAPPASQIPRLMADLLNWLASTDIHPLIAGSVFHYEFEFIHPFSDGNGRLGRLWQTLILSQWRSQMAFLPVESVIRDHQERYYLALSQADQQSDCTGFIELMLSLLAEALAAGIPSLSPTLSPTHMSEIMSEKGADKNLQAILTALAQTPQMTIGQLAALLNVSTRTIERHLKSLQNNGQLKRIGPPRGGHWQVLVSPRKIPRRAMVNYNEDTLAVFYLFKKPDLNKREIKKIKKVATSLLDTLKAQCLAVDHWRAKEATRDAVKQQIFDFLYDETTGLPVEEYPDEEIQGLTQNVLQHVYRVYPTLPSPVYGFMDGGH